MIITFLDKPSGGGTSGVVVTSKSVNVSSNPQVITSSEGYAWSAVTINSDNVYSSGYTDGYASGSTDGFDTGYASGSTDGYSSGYTDGYSSGYTDGSAVASVGYGVFADMTGVGFIEDDFTTGTAIEMDLAIPSLAAYLSGETGETILHIANYNTGGNGLNCEYSIGAARPNGYQRLKATCTSGGTLYTLELGLNKEEGLNTRVKMRIRRGVASYPRNISYYLERIMDTNTDGAYAVGGYAEGLPSSYNDTLYMFSYGGIIENLPHYLKEYKKYHNSTGTSGGDVLVQHIVARSDGKMWDLITNQEANIDWIKYDGTHPTTFNMISDYDI